jgi:hypothetical protein
MDNRKSQSGAVSGDRERARQRKEVMGLFRTKMCRAMPNSWRPSFLFRTTTWNNLETRKRYDTDSLSMAGVWRRRGGLEEQLRHGWMNLKNPHVGRCLLSISSLLASADEWLAASNADVDRGPFFPWTGLQMYDLSVFDVSLAALFFPTFT